MHSASDKELGDAESPKVSHIKTSFVKGNAKASSNIHPGYTVDAHEIANSPGPDGTGSDSNEGCEENSEVAVKHGAVVGIITPVGATNGCNTRCNNHVILSGPADVSK